MSKNAINHINLTFYWKGVNTENGRLVCLPFFDSSTSLTYPLFLLSLFSSSAALDEACQEAASTGREAPRILKRDIINKLRR